MKVGGWCCVKSSEDHSLQLATEAVFWLVGVFCALVADFSQWLPYKHMPLLSIVYAAGFDSASNVPQKMTAWHAWLVGTKQVQKNYWRNGQMNDVVKELAGQNTLNERPILCNFLLNNNLPLWSQWTPRKVKSPAYIYFAAPIFRKPPSMMSQRHK